MSNGRFLEGLNAGIKVAEEIALWLDGKNQLMASKQVESERLRIMRKYYIDRSKTTEIIER